MAVSKNNKYLIISPSWLGDLIMSQSLYKTLKKLEPDCVIDIYAPGYTMPILDRMEEIDNKNASKYKENASKYIAQIEEIDSKIKVKVIGKIGPYYDERKY